MYLTRFRLNTARGGTRKLLSSPQAMHAAVMSSFVEILPSAPGAPRVLWRVDHNAKAEVFLYIVSLTKPDLTHLVEQAGWPTTPVWDTRDYEPFLSRLTAGERWAFRLTANPVHSIRRKDGEPIKRTAHVTPRHQIGWLLARQEAAGFRVLQQPEGPGLREIDRYELVVHNRHNLAFDKSADQPGRKNRVSLATATFDGRLEVTDPQALQRALTTGLGRAKAYGCGLMTLAPAT